MSMKPDLIISGNQIVTPEGIVSASLLIGGGKILDILPAAHGISDCPVEHAGDNFVIPGVIDPHVHINEPGRTEWEGFDTATRAAAAGGITTLIDMPLNSSPVTTSLENFRTKINASQGKLHVNCGLYGGVVPDNQRHLEELLDAGVFGLKAFLTHSGIDDFPNTTSEHLIPALNLLKKYDRPLLVHCELDEMHPGIAALDNNPRSYQAYLNSRPKSWENSAIQLMIELCRKTGAHVHIVHLSSAEALPMIRAARKEGLPLTVETGPHYLFFDAESIPDASPEFKCAPPIREQANNRLLWEALLDGTIDFVATDHSPAPPELKAIESGSFQDAWGGIAGLQFSLQAMWTLASDRQVPINKMVDWMCTNPAAFLKKSESKGAISKGMDADLCIWNPLAEIITTQSEVHHRHKLSPYCGIKLRGQVLKTFVNGKVVFSNGGFQSLGAGKLLFCG
jgi:allantoinase